jgi:hypothetical protein
VEGYQEYPKWVAVDNDGDPLQPGYVLCENEAEERIALGKPRLGRPVKDKNADNPA